MPTTKAPNVPIESFKRTKIIATVGPSTNSYQAIYDLIKFGANGLRLNFSHGTSAERDQQIAWIRKASKAYGKPVAIIQDLHGPKMQLGDFEGGINVETGQDLTFKYNATYVPFGAIPTRYDLSRKVKRDQRLSLFDGKVNTTVTSVKDGVVHARAENRGILIKNKGINLPDTDFEGDIITSKDRQDLAYGSAKDIDYVAASFIQTAGDIREFRKLMQSLNFNAKLIAKIETKAAVDNLEDIMVEADAVMVARGDLAIETSPESVPIVQRRIIGLGLRHATPTIVATQMLASMTEEPEPTRAEVSDIATAVIVGADAVMLSEETAIGQYPIEAVQVMKRVILYTEANNPLKAVFPETDAKKLRPVAIADAVILLADNVQAKAIVSETKSGATVLQIAARRPKQPIIFVTSETRIACQLSIVYGTKSYERPDDKLQATKLTNWLQKNKVLGSGDIVVMATGKHPGVVGMTDTIKIRVL